MQVVWMKFPNGKVWQVDLDGWTAAGSVMVPEFTGIDDQEERLDAVAEAVTGSAAGLTDFWVEHLGNGRVAFSGSVDLEPEDESLAPVALVNTDLNDLRTALQAQYALSDIEVTHALMNLGTEYGEECVLSTREAGRELRCPAFPLECSYVRVVIDGLELAYWVEDEWRDDPAVVMGAIFGAARGAS
jgi:hypothetical protein